MLARRAFLVAWLIRGASAIVPEIRRARCVTNFPKELKELLMVVTIGIDPHKGSHTAVALDERETVLGQLRVSSALSNWHA